MPTVNSFSEGSGRRGGRLRRTQLITGIACVSAAVLGMAILVFGPGLGGPAVVTVVNRTGVDLVSLHLQAGVAEERHPILGGGLRITSRLKPDDSRELIVTFGIEGAVKRLRCGNIGWGERRTIAILEKGDTAIVSFGVDDAVADVLEAETIAR